MTIKLEENLVKDGATLFFLYSFLKRLVLRFTEWPAYKNGLIDERGNILKKRKDMSHEEKQTFSKFDVLVLNMKKIMEKIPGGKSRIASFAAALFLLKEGKDYEDQPLSVLSERLEEYIISAELLEEEGGVPANQSGSGNLARKDDASTVLFKKKKKEFTSKKFVV